MRKANIYLNNITSKINCGTALRMNSRNPNLIAHADEQDKITYIITGHRNGQVILFIN